MIGEWQGIVRASDLQMTAVVHYEGPSCLSLGDWYGGGSRNNLWPDREFIETNIGTLIVVHQIQNEEGEYVIQFMGYGLPQGPLAARMGLPE